MNVAVQKVLWKIFSWITTAWNLKIDSNYFCRENPVLWKKGGKKGPKKKRAFEVV